MPTKVGALRAFYDGSRHRIDSSRVLKIQNCKTYAS